MISKHGTRTHAAELIPQRHSRCSLSTKCLHARAGVDLENLLQIAEHGILRGQDDMQHISRPSTCFQRQLSNGDLVVDLHPDGELEQVWQVTHHLRKVPVEKAIPSISPSSTHHIAPHCIIRGAYLICTPCVCAPPKN